MQKLRWANVGSKKEAKPNVLATFLVAQWAWGHMSAPMLQKIAHHAAQDGLDHPEVAALAKLGGSGVHPQNCNRDLMKCLHQPPVMSSLTTMQVHVKKSLGIKSCTQHVLLPHELFSALYHNHPAAFRKRILGGDQSNVRTWWDSMDEHPAYAGHPLKSRTDHKLRCIPLALHGDAVPVSGIGKAWSKSAEGYGWSSMIGEGNTADLHFLIWIMYTKLIVRSPEFDKSKIFMKKLKWSFYWLFLGVWPARNEHDEPLSDARAGTPLAGGFYAVLWALKGDLDHMFKAYHLRCPTSGQPCSLCKANMDTVPWTDARPGAAWTRTIWSDTEWIASHPERHILFHLPGLSISSYVPDILHTLHIGAYQYAFGSVLHFLTKTVMPESPEKNLDKLWEMIQHFYKVCGSCVLLNIHMLAQSPMQFEHTCNINTVGAQQGECENTASTCIVDPCVAIATRSTSQAPDSTRSGSRCFSPGLGIFLSSEAKVLK